MCVCVCVCVCLHDNSKRNSSRNTKLEYVVVYENSSEEFDIELRRIKVKVTVGVQKFSPFTTIQTVRSYSSTLVQARNLILSMYVHLILIYKIEGSIILGDSHRFHFQETFEKLLRTCILDLRNHSRMNRHHNCGFERRPKGLTPLGLPSLCPASSLTWSTCYSCVFGKRN